MTKPAGVDLIVPVYKNAHITKECLQSIFDFIDEIEEFDPKVVAVNDSPDDPAVNALLDEFARNTPRFTLLTNPVNAGFVASVNRGLAAAIRAGRDVVLINSDTLTYRGTLAELLRVAHLDSMVGFVSPRSNNASICSLPLEFHRPKPTPQQAHDHWRLLCATMPAFHHAPTAIGFYFYIKHKILANFGGLRDDFGVGYEEENDLAIRASKAGYKAVLANHAFAYHHGSASFSLLDIDLAAHRQTNLLKNCELNPEFLPLVHRYQASPHYRAEVLLTPLIHDAAGKASIVFDLADLSCHFNGTNELALGVLAGFCRQLGHVFNIHASCSKAAFMFHRLNAVENLTRVNPSGAGVHAIAVRLGQPFLQRHVDRLEQLAPINVYGMLDTIAEDCGQLSITQNLDALWRHVADHANGVFFISQFSRHSFTSRYGIDDERRLHTRLLPTRLSEYAGEKSAADGSHLLVLGNHFPHKGADTTAALLSDLFPSHEIVVLGAEGFVKPRVHGYQSGLLPAEEVRGLFAEARVVVLPSHVEGFGFGLLHALAAGKPVVARRIDATEEILATYRSFSGVYLFDNDLELKAAVEQALRCAASTVEDSAARTWDDWCGDFGRFCQGLLTQGDLFSRLVGRIRHADLLRASDPDPNAGKPLACASNLDELLRLEGQAFVHMTYRTLLQREPDEGGEQNFLDALGAGTSKREIIDTIRNSPEGKIVAAELPGLD